jgi:hypothetical protein
VHSLVSLLLACTCRAGQNKYDRESLLCQTSRFATCDLILHARMHPEVTVALASEISSLADTVVAPQFSRISAANSGSDDAKSRLALFPALMHLISQSSLDAGDAMQAQALAKTGGGGGGATTVTGRA